MGEEVVESSVDMASMVAELSEGLGFDGGDDGGSDDSIPRDGAGNPDQHSGDDAVDKLGAPADKSGADAPAGTGTPAPKPGVAGDGTELPGNGAPAAGTAVAPKTWRAEAAAEWAKLPPVVQAEIAKREEDMFQGLEGYKQDASWGKALKTVLDPYAAIMQQHNIDPIVQVKGLMNAHYQLATGSAQAKADMLSKLLVDYKIDPALVRIGEAPGEAPYVDPTVKALRTELDEVKSSLQQNQADREKALRADLDVKITKFFADPKNVYVQELGNEIANLIEKGVAKDLDDAYQQAIWLNPVVRAKEVERQRVEAETVRVKDVADKAAAAKAASAANVKARARGGSAAAPLGTMDDTMAATLREIHSREGS